MRALGEGMLAGFGVAIPVGPISVLLIETGLRRGFRIAAAGAFGAASADLLWAMVAALAGLAVAGALEPWADTVRVVSGCVLLALAGYRMYALVQTARAAAPRARMEAGPAGTYVRFVGLTALNATTIAYFAALIISLRPGTAPDAGSKFLFVGGAFAASVSWQLVLAGVSSGLHRRLTDRARLATAVLGNALIVALALRLLF